MIKIHQELSNLLARLKFSQICAENLPDYSRPEPITLPDDGLFYPDLSAHKNGFKYLFKTLTKPSPQIDGVTEKLKKILKSVEKDNGTEFVLVVQYGLKQNYYDWAQENGVSLHNIWEINCY